MKARTIIRKFPKFAAEFDGSAEECTLSWYYTYNRALGIFEFKDADAEDEVAEMLGVVLYKEAVIDEDSTGSKAKPLSAEEIDSVREYLADIRRGLDFLGETNTEK